jgi:hypothetical protein
MNTRLIKLLRRKLIDGDYDDANVLTVLDLILEALDTPEDPPVDHVYRSYSAAKRAIKELGIKHVFTDHEYRNSVLKEFVPNIVVTRLTAMKLADKGIITLWDHEAYEVNA